MTIELKEPKKNKLGAGDASKEAIHVIREGTVTASISKRQSPSGYSYYDYSLSRSWKSLSSGKTGHSKNFFSRNQHDLNKVIEEATKWIRCIMHRRTSLPSQRPSSNSSEGFRLICRRLSTCNPLPHYGVLITSLTATHRLPAGGRSGSCVSQFLHSMSSVSEQVSLHGKYDSECGRQAAPLFKRLDPKVQAFDFRLRN